jgi:hypothetical protein
MKIKKTNEYETLLFDAVYKTYRKNLLSHLSFQHKNYTLINFA